MDRSFAPTLNQPHPRVNEHCIGEHIDQTKTPTKMTIQNCPGQLHACALATLIRAPTCGSPCHRCKSFYFCRQCLQSSKPCSAILSLTTRWLGHNATKHAHSNGGIVLFGWWILVVFKTT